MNSYSGHSKMMSSFNSSIDSQGDIGVGWDRLQFIPHSSLSYNPTNNTEYLQDDCLWLRVKTVVVWLQVTSIYNEYMYFWWLYIFLPLQWWQYYFLWLLLLIYNHMRTHAFLCYVELLQTQGFIHPVQFTDNNFITWWLANSIHSHSTCSCAVQ